MRHLRLSKLDLALLLANVLALGGLLVLMAVRGADVPVVLLAVGAAGMAAGRLGRALAGPKAASSDTAPARGNGGAVGR